MPLQTGHEVCECVFICMFMHVRAKQFLQTSYSSACRGMHIQCMLITRIALLVHKTWDLGQVNAGSQVMYNVMYDLNDCRLTKSVYLQLIQLVFEN